MKTILVPTDFSENSDNAIDYAAQLALLSNSSLIFFHVYHTPLLTPETALLLPKLEEIEKISENALNKLKIKYNEKYPSLNIIVKTKCGLGAEEIIDYANDNKVNLIVMGMRGAGILEEKLAGSVTTSVMEKVKIPVFAIDEFVKFKSPRKIILATDYNDATLATYEILIDLAKQLKAHIYVLKVVPTDSYLPEAEEALEGIKLKNVLEGTNHTFHVVANESVTDGINQYADKIEADLVVMVAHQHSFIHKIFKEPHTKQMAFHSKVPLLCLHDN
ncbi:MAG: universal stress protein [Sphingobacteriaceae bacterium]|nr:universal stress protein [Sphingobacteriaceae bacterium]